MLFVLCPRLSFVGVLVGVDKEMDDVELREGKAREVLSRMFCDLR